MRGVVGTYKAECYKSPDHNYSTTLKENYNTQLMGVRLLHAKAI